MKPYRPKPLDDFDREFFSGSELSEEPVESPFTHAEGEEPSHTAEGKTPVLTPEIIEGLINLNLSQSEPGAVFTELPDEGRENSDKNVTPEEIAENEVHPAESSEEPLSQEEFDNQPTAPSKRKPQISEEEALKSFPDFEPAVFEPTENQDSSDYEYITVNGSQESVKEHKKRVKKELKQEKDKIKAQYRLEKKVQKPFKAKKILIFFMLILLLAGILAAGVVGVFYLTGTSPETSLDIGSYSVIYVNGAEVRSDETHDSLILLSHENVTGAKTILYQYQDQYRLDTIVAIGDGAYAVRINGETKVIHPEDVRGVVYYSVSGIRDIYVLAHNQPKAALTAVGLYMCTVIVFFAIVISFKNKKISNYRESYQLVE